MQKAAEVVYGPELAEDIVNEEFGRVSVGDLHSSVTVGERTVSRGDVMVFEDELDERDFNNGIISRVFIGFVTAVLNPKWDGEPELFTSASIGRIPVRDAEVSGEGSRVDSQTGNTKFVDQFLNSDFERELVIEHGEGIGENGEDFRRSGK